MEIISLINNFIKDFNQKFLCNINPFTIESKIRDVGDNFTINLYETFINYLDEKFKHSEYRKQNYRIKETRLRRIITSLGEINVNFTSYYSKVDNKRYVFLRDTLGLEPYQRLSLEAEYQITKYAMENNMSQAAKHALRNAVISRSTVSKKIKVLDGSIEENIVRSTNQPKILYIEMDEIHANLQFGGNANCPCAIVHEGYVEEFVKRKKLKNIHYFASSILSYEELWEVIYDYVDKKYDIDKFDKIFISGDGASGIKNFDTCFPNAIYVFDHFHYMKKHMRYIFKNENEIKYIADEYIRNGLIDDFKKLVHLQIEKYPDQEKEMIKHMNTILNNIEGIKNQNLEDYKTHCSMEGHVSQAFARHITSSPYGFSRQGLENKLKLLVYHANKVELTIEDYYNLKYGKNSYIEIVKKIKNILNIKRDIKLIKNYTTDYEVQVCHPLFDSNKLTNQYRERTDMRPI